MKPKSTLRSFLLLAGSSLLAISSASAADFWWDGNDGSWGDLTKWSSDDTGTTDPLALPTTADTATFNITGNNNANNITLDGDRAALNLLFNSTGATNIRGNSTGTTARTLNFGATASITLASGAGAVTIGDDPATYGAVNLSGGGTTWTVTNSSLTVNGNVNIGGGRLTIGAGDASGTITINGKISGSIAGTGQVMFLTTKSRVVLANDANDFVGQTYVTGNNGIGTLAFTSIADYGTACALGTGTGTGNNPIQLGTGTTASGRLEYIGTTDSSTNRTVQLGSTSAGQTSAGEIVNNSTNNSKLVFTAANFNPTISGISAARTLTLGGSSTGANEIQGIIQDNNTAGGGIVNLTKSGAGTWRLSGTSSYTGVTTVSGTGPLEFSVAADGGSNSSLGSSSNAASNLLLNNTSTLRYIGTGGSTDRSFTINGTGNGNNATLDASGSGAIHFTNTASPAYGTNNQGRNLILGGTNTGDNTLAANIADNGTGVVTITKNGTGKWILSGTSTNTAGVIMNEGTLLINGSLSGGANLNVNGGILGGIGTIGRQVVVYPGGSLSPGASVGTLSLGGNLTFALFTGTTTGKLIYELGPIASSDKIDLTTGTLVLGTGLIDLDDFTLTAGVGLENGTYTLISTTKVISGTLGPNTSGTLGGASITLQKSGDNKSLELVVSGLGGGSAYDTWKTANSVTGTPDQDQDGDGVSNAVEFVLGGTSLTNDLGKLPVAAANGSNMTFTFLRKQSSIDPKTSVSVEVGTNLVTWDTAPSPYTVPDGAAANNPGVTVVKGVPADYDTITLTVPQDSAKKFARLKVVITP